MGVDVWGSRENVKAAHHNFSLVTACSLNVLIVLAIECCNFFKLSETSGQVKSNMSCQLR